MGVEPREYCPVCNEVTLSTLKQGAVGTHVYCACCGNWLDMIPDEYESEAADG